MESYKQDKVLFITVIVSIVVSTFVNMGICNDFAYQVSKCPLFILFIMISDKLFDFKFKSVPGVVIILFTSIAFLTYVRQCIVNRKELSFPPTKNVHSRLEFLNPVGPVQTTGSLDSFFFKHLIDYKK